MIQLEKLSQRALQGWSDLLATQHAFLDVLDQFTQSARGIESWSMELVDARAEVVYSSGEGHYLSAEACLYDAKSGLTPLPGPGGPPLLLGPHASPCLPSINIPIFSGHHEDWQSFRDLFQALIYQDARLTDVERLYYLKSHHHHLLVQDHITPLRTLKTLREESTAGLQGLLNTLEKHRDQLKALKQPVEQWDVWMISFASTTMNPSTWRAWEDELEKLDAAALAPREVATFANLSSFLRRRGRSLTSVEALRSLRSVSDSFSSRSTSGRPAGPAPIDCNHRTLATQAAEDDCSACHAPHYIGRCSRFLQLDETARRALVAQSKLCFNCLRSGYIAHSCPSQGVCQHCSARHHSLIHDGSRKRKADPESTSAQTQRARLTTDSKESFDLAVDSQL
ncbi:uncharacterized protein LOC106647228 [Copidosoma floridanum]|uniref:uncharacterized protein LOC106647228 n=1 Tax=Copidosoma floridanum TaxID=29053 RepID=UPI0006C9D7CC|nr:uncharacterized protein LOC106647228 [Copidosoma floridanum]